MDEETSAPKAVGACTTQVITESDEYVARLLIPSPDSRTGWGEWWVKRQQPPQAQQRQAGFRRSAS